MLASIGFIMIRRSTLVSAVTNLPTTGRYEHFLPNNEVCSLWTLVRSLFQLETDNKNTRLKINIVDEPYQTRREW